MHQLWCNTSSIAGSLLCILLLLRSALSIQAEGRVKVTLYIIRHAEKERGNFYNARLRHQDEPISQSGQAQAHKFWSYFCDKQIAAIYVREYQRTAQTIEFVAP